MKFTDPVRAVLAGIAVIAISFSAWEYTKYVQVRNNIDTNEKLIEAAKSSSMQCVTLITQFKERQTINRDLLIQLHALMAELELKAGCKKVK